MRDNRWTHAVCNQCWIDMEGERQPVRLNPSTKEPCCRCGQPTASGIYTRGEINKYPHCTFEVEHSNDPVS